MALSTAQQRKKPAAAGKLAPALPSSAATVRGAMHRVSPQTCANLQDVIDAAKANDCIFLDPGEYTLPEPLQVAKPLHIIGIDEVGAFATLSFDAKDLKPAVPLLRVDGASCRVKGVKFRHTHDEKAVAAGRTAAQASAAVATAHAITVSAGSSVILDECVVASSCGGVKVAADAYLSALCVRFEAQGTAVTLEGLLYADRCDVVGAHVGVSVAATGNGTLEGSCFNGCRTGVSILGAAMVRAEACAFLECDVGLAIRNGVTPPKTPSVKGNEFHRCRVGITVDGEQCAIEVVKNYLHDCGEHALLVLDGVAEIRANAIKDCAGVGVGVLGGAPVLEGNVVQNSRTAGIHVRQSRPTIRLNEVVGHRATDDSVAILVDHPLDRVELLSINQADPHVEANVLGENACNIRVVHASGTFLKNELLVSQGDNVVISQPQAIAVTLNANEILGSVSGNCIAVSEHAQLKALNNKICGAKLAGVSMSGCGFSEVRGNTFDACQTAVIAMHRSSGRVADNVTNGLAVDVFSDSQMAVSVTGNH